MREPTENKFCSLVAVELFLAVLMGGAPLWIAYCIGGIQELEHELSGLISSSIVIWWSAAMSLFGFLLLALNKWKLKLSDFEEKIWKKIKPISIEVASTLIGILRVIAGLLIGFVFLWAIEDSGSFYVQGGAYFMLLAGGAIFDSAALTWAKHKVS